MFEGWDDPDDQQNMKHVFLMDSYDINVHSGCIHSSKFPQCRE